MATKSVTIKTPYGLFNFGATCFMNGAIQFLIPVLGPYFRTGTYCLDLKQTPESSGDEMVAFVKTYAHLTTAIENLDGKWHMMHVRKYLIDFLKHLHQFTTAEMFLDRQQHDSHDFLVFLVSTLAQGLAYPHQIKIKVTSPDLTNLERTRLLSFKSWQKEFKNRYSWFYQQMYGQFYTTLSCGDEKCQGNSQSFDAYCAITLGITDCTELSQCFDKFVEPEQLDEDNMWLCNECKTKTRATKQLVLWKTPDVLIIHLKRFQQVTMQHLGTYHTAYHKDSHAVEYPIRGLDLSRWVCDQSPNGEIFDLVAVCFHAGSLHGGHYTTARKVGDEWKLFNDTVVSPISEEKLVNAMGYYLMYIRRDSPVVDEITDVPQDTVETGTGTGTETEEATVETEV